MCDDSTVHMQAQQCMDIEAQHGPRGRTWSAKGLLLFVSWLVVTMVVCLALVRSHRTEYGLGVSDNIRYEEAHRHLATRLQIATERTGPKRRLLTTAGKGKRTPAPKAISAGKGKRTSAPKIARRAEASKVKAKLRGTGIPATKRIKDDYIIKLVDGVTDAQVEALCESFENTKKERRCERLFRKAVNAVEVKLTRGRLAKLMEKYDEYIEFAEVNGIATVAETWGLDRIDQRALPLDNAFVPATGGNQGEGVDVFVLDTGLRKTHSEFGDRAFHLWSAFDSHGDDVNGHGTHCSGTVAGGTYGVAKKAHVWGVKILSDSGSGSWSGIIEGCEKVIEHCSGSSRRCVASMSLGGGYSASVNAAITAMKNSGITVVVAAGNENDDACSYSPASSAAAITVGATTSSDQRSSFSNTGSCVDIYAPGSAITSATADSDTSIGSWSGTSMACPHVAGVAALMLADDARLTPSQLQAALLSRSTEGALSGLTPSCPNKLLYYGETSAPTMVPSPAPTNVGDTNPPTTAEPTMAPTLDYGTCASTGALFTSPRGTLSDGTGRYTNGARCSWTISTGRSITLTFESFALETGWDFVSVFDGTSASASRLGQFSGESRGDVGGDGTYPPLGSVAATAGSGSMFVLFESDASVTSAGFIATWSSPESDSPTPSEAPTLAPTATPTELPTVAPSRTPSFAPSTRYPTAGPTAVPTAAPTEEPTFIPTEVPTEVPSTSPTHSPSSSPSVTPTVPPTPQPPTFSPTVDPTATPTDPPSASPTVTPTDPPTAAAACTDVPTPWMRRRGKSCADVERTLRKKCSRNPNWRRRLFCSQSCANVGLAYASTICTGIPTQAPSFMPTTAPVNSSCSDIATRSMERQGKVCSVLSRSVLERKCARRQWRTKKYCQRDRKSVV